MKVPLLACRSHPAVLKRLENDVMAARSQGDDRRGREVHAVASSLDRSQVNLKTSTGSSHERKKKELAPVLVKRAGNLPPRLQVQMDRDRRVCGR